jgi:predicted transcriptional regulator
MELFQYWKEHGKPVMGEPYRQKLLADPNWKDDPIWAAAEGKALLKTYHEREGMEVYKEREGREEAASPHKTQTSQPTPPLPLIQSTSLGAIPTSTAGFVHGTAVQAEPSGQQPEAVSQPSPQPAAETAAETTTSLSPDGLLTGSTTPSVGDRTGPETPGSAILGQVSSSVVMVPGEEGPSGDGAEEADNEGEEEQEGSEGRRHRTAGPTPAFKKRMVIVLNVIHERNLHANSEVAAAIGSSRRQTLRYLNELVDGGFLSEDKKQYFVTEKGQKVFQ